MQVNEYILLAPYTTFYIGGPSRYLIFAQTDDEVVEAVKFAKDEQLPLFVMGGGSNSLVADKGFDGVTVRIETVGIDIVSEDEHSIVLKIASGEVWDDVVRMAVLENWWGIENLSHIPGFMGGFAVQNVGAYGQEASEVVESVEVLDLETNEIKTLVSSELNFSYRHSIFNSTHRHRYIILHTLIRLSKISAPNLSYGDLAKRFTNQSPLLTDIREAVIAIRNIKFPFPSEPTKGNSGSFFRGRILSEIEFQNLSEKLFSSFGEDALTRLQAMISNLKVAQGYKTPVAFLIELVIGKELTVGGASLNPNQPAIIVNSSGQALASDVLKLFKQVQLAVLEQTGVKLEVEPELIGFSPEETTGLKYD